MPLVSLRNLSFGFTSPPLLDGINLEIEPGERIGLLGRNGAGKSTLMKLIAGQLEADHGQVLSAPGTRIARLVQEVPGGEAGTIAELVATGWIPSGDPESDAWQREQAVNRVLSKMGLDGSAEFATLSSGLKRRALLAQALVCEPQLLLLDEPTNHLDIDAIAWLERFLQGYRGALVFVTHDRVFLQALAGRIIEIDRGRLFDWSCDYATFLVRKAAALEAEEKQQAQFDKHLAQEEAWIRQGIKARRTRNEGRVKALKKLRLQRSQRRERIGNVHLRAVEAERSGLLVIEANEISFRHQPDGPLIVDQFSTLITRGEKVGIIGPNGSGKTTLLKLLLGELEPTSGSVRHGTRLEVIYFDQLRQQLDEEKSVVENMGEGQETIEIGGKRKHIYGYLQDFLFTPDRARQPVKFLSGGERNRLLLARLFKRPSNVMVLDEPTNDLDAETLELLEELVADYSGTLLLVSHDRAFLNNVVTSTLALEGNGKIKAYDGGYDDYVRQREASALVEETPAAKKPAAKPRPQQPADGPAKLNYNETRELAALPEQIEQLETQQAELHATMADPAFYQQDGAAIAAATAQLEQLTTKLQTMYARWEELEARA